jgi:serine/threonine-protein kinase
MGTAIVGRYVLLGPIGYGGVSVVYQAVDSVGGRRAAVKLLSPAFAADAYAREKVHNEALITARLRHPSVPRVFGFGDVALPGGGSVPYVAMELLRGAVLAGRLTGGPLPWPEAVRVAATVADVLTIAHRRGVVHRDVTPANIMMTLDGPKIIDFGEATTVEPTSPAARSEAPLPFRPVSTGGAPADDVYALGVVLYQMLTGASPYGGGQPRNALAAARLRTIAPTPVLVVPGMPRAVAEICRGCMAKRPEDRPGAARVALDLWGMAEPAAAGDAGLSAPTPVPLTALPPRRAAPRHAAPVHPRPAFAVAGRSAPYSTGSG